jgi:hypothetical protein
VAADIPIEWTRDLGDGRILAMARATGGYQASLSGFCGFGSTQEKALDALLGHMRDYVDAADDFARALELGGTLDTKLQQIRQLVDQKVAAEDKSASGGRA